MGRTGFYFLVAILSFGPEMLMLALDLASPFTSICLHSNGFLNALIYGIFSTPLRRMAKAATRNSIGETVQTGYNSSASNNSSNAIIFDSNIEELFVSIEEGEARRKAEAEIRAL